MSYLSVNIYSGHVTDSFQLRIDDDESTCSTNTSADNNNDTDWMAAVCKLNEYSLYDKLQYVYLGE